MLPPLGFALQRVVPLAPHDQECLATALGRLRLLRVSPLPRQVQDVIDGVGGGRDHLAVTAPPVPRHQVRQPEHGAQADHHEQGHQALRAARAGQVLLLLCAQAKAWQAEAASLTASQRSCEHRTGTQHLVSCSP